MNDFINNRMQTGCKTISDQILLQEFYNISVIVNTLAKRIQHLRKQKGWSQSELARRIKISYPQMSRYEVKGVQPPADVLKRLSDALGTSVDFLLYGDKDSKVKAALSDNDLLELFKSVEQLDEKDKQTVKTLIDAFLAKRQLQKLAR